MRGFLRNLIRRSKPKRQRKTVGLYDAVQTTPENRRHWANADHMSANAANSPHVRREARSRARYEAANNSTHILSAGGFSE